MRKRWYCILMAICMGFSVSACGNNNASDTVATATTEEAPETEELPKEKPQKNGFDEKTNSEVQVGEYIFSIPSYYDADVTEADHYRAYPEPDNDTAVIEIYATVDEEDPVSYEALVEEVENGYVQKLFENWFDSYDGITAMHFETGDVKGFTYSTNYKLKDSSGYAQGLIFPSVDDNKWISVILNQMDDTDYSYTDDFKKIMNSVKQIEKKEP